MMDTAHPVRSRLRAVSYAAVALAATAAGLGSGTAQASTEQATPSALVALTLAPSDVVGGGTSTGTVKLSSPAPAGGIRVALSSDNPIAARVPVDVTVAAGATSASFKVSTLTVTNSQSALVIGTAGGATAYSIVTVWTPFAFSHGSLSVFPGGTGSGTVTSQPAGISCSFAGGGATGACSASFAAGTVVRLTAKAGKATSFEGWRGVGCADASKVTVGRASNIACQAGFVQK